ncbi:MAG: hypothetical protein B7Z58_14810 [Acidiphilium sp. 37-64-53]|nr:MAG: hypothetical protein B7Z58_14810 [Acidiphilium sp. 37-64-53]
MLPLEDALQLIASEDIFWAIRQHQPPKNAESRDEVSDIKSVEALISRYIVREIGRAQNPRCGIPFSSSNGSKSQISRKASAVTSTLKSAFWGGLLGAVAGLPLRVVHSSFR